MMEMYSKGYEYDSENKCITFNGLDPSEVEQEFMNFIND